MTANDNIRHYIGDLEAREDIDLVFKHIFDLMLANGGEGSGFNADMVDGYHASDFAPASIVDEIEQCIHTIYLSGRTYEGREVTLDVIAQDISYTSNTIYNSVLSLQEFLDKIEEMLVQNNKDINEMKAVTNMFTAETLAKLNKLLNENFKCSEPDEDGDRVCYLDANSVNGISFILVTQYQYDTAYTEEQKKDPHNVFIINDDIEGYSDYAPPSVLRAGMDLRFQLNEANESIEYSIDKGQTWKFALPLFATKDANGGTVQKGILNPAWFEPMKTYMTGTLAKQEKYPFLLTSEYLTAINQVKDNINKIGSKWMFGIKLDDDTTAYTLASQNSTNGILNLNLKTYLTSWLTNNLNTIKASLNLPDFNTFEKKSNKTDSINTTPQATDKNKYPSAYAVSTSLQGQDNKINQTNQNVNTICNFLNQVYYYDYTFDEAKTKGYVTCLSTNDSTKKTSFQIDSSNYKTFEDVVAASYYKKGGDNEQPYTKDNLAVFDWQGLLKRYGTDGRTVIAKPYVTFARQGNVCTMRVYGKVAMWKNTNDASTKGFYMEIPICTFPQGYRPIHGGFYQNPISQHSTNKKWNLNYYHIVNNKLYLQSDHKDKILGYQSDYTGTIDESKRGNVLIAFQLTYFTADTILTVNGNTVNNIGV